MKKWKNGFLANLEHQFQAEVSLPSIQLPPSSPDPSNPCLKKSDKICICNVLGFPHSSSTYTLSQFMINKNIMIKTWCVHWWCKDRRSGRWWRRLGLGFVEFECTKMKKKDHIILTVNLSIYLKPYQWTLRHWEHLYLQDEPLTIQPKVPLPSEPTHSSIQSTQ